MVCTGFGLARMRTTTSWSANKRFERPPAVASSVVSGCSSGIGKVGTQVESDVRSGKLDKVIAEADADYKAGRTLPL